jgi:hypothetical protein
MRKTLIISAIAFASMSHAAFAGGSKLDSGISQGDAARAAHAQKVFENRFLDRARAASYGTVPPYDSPRRYDSGPNPSRSPY